MFSPLLDGLQDYVKGYELILMQLGRVGHGPGKSPLNFGVNLEPGVDQEHNRLSMCAI